MARVARNITSLLPNEILLDILDYLDYLDLLRLALLCKRFSCLISSSISFYEKQPCAKTPLCQNLFLSAPLLRRKANNNDNKEENTTKYRGYENIRIHPVLTKFASEFEPWSSDGVYVSYNIGTHTILTTPSTIPFHEALINLEKRGHRLSKALYQNATVPAVRELCIISEFRPDEEITVEGMRRIGYDEEGDAYGGREEEKRGKEVLCELGVKTTHRPAHGHDALSGWRITGFRYVDE